ncbi:MAG: alanine racemase [bacterium]|nr:alanine racemase [bacterium]
MHRLIHLFRKWKLRNYTPLIKILIHKDNLLYNLRAFQKAFPNIQIAPVLKSNAYGHGLNEIAKILNNENIPFLCVDSYYEALALRVKGVKLPILTIGYTPIENLKRKPPKNISFSIISLEELKQIAKTTSSPRSFHLKFDTGMHRHGIAPEELPEALRYIRQNKNIKIEGVFSHFADADTPNSELTKIQIERWNRIAETIKKELPETKYFHLAATAGSAYSNEINTNTIRLGLGLYGMDRLQNRNLNLKPVLEMQTKISSIRKVAQGEPVGYSATFRAPHEMSIATIPVGYYEGIDRRLGNKGFVQIENTPCPIIGRVSMNITSIDVSSVPNAEIGTPVTAISKNPEDENSIQNMARLAETTPYVILVHLPAHLRREVVQ